MRTHGNRTTLLNKADLIERIKENKAKHIEMYNKAVKAYRKEALKQLAELTEQVKEGKTNIGLNLVEPINNSENYDKIIEMFEWDVRDEVELDQNEFKEYVQDETSHSRMAMMSNMTYLS